MTIIMPALISTFASEHRNTDDFACRGAMATQGVCFDPCGMLQVALGHTYQLLDFEEAGGHTVSINQNEMFIWK